MIVVLLVVAILIAEVIDDAVKESPQVSRRANASWAAGLEPLLAMSSSMGKSIQTIDSGSSAISRAALDATLGALTAVTSANLSDFAGLGIAAPSSSDHGLAADVFSDRRAAALDLQQSVNLATSPSGSEQSAVSSCAAEQSAIKSGDRALATLEHVLQTTPGILHLHFATWSSYAPILGQGGCSTLVSALRANNGLALRSALRIVAISLSPNPVQVNGVASPTTTTTTTTTTVPLTTTTTIPFGGLSTTTSTSSTTSTTTTVPVTTTTLQIPPASARSVLPPTNSITAAVVLEDVGTAAARSVTLTATLLTSGNRVVATETRTLLLLGAGSSHYFSLGPLKLGKIRGTFVLDVSATATSTASVRSAITLGRSG